MKNVKMLLLLFAAALITFTACKKDDDEPGEAIEITAIEISADNTVVDVTFNQALYANADKTGALPAGSFVLTFMATSAVTAGYNVEHTAGSNKVKFLISYETRVRGNESLEVTAKANTIYGAEGNQLKSDQKITVDVKDLGVIGKWSAYDISAILIGLGFDDSLYANFKADQSYIVNAFAGGFPIVLEGTYTMNKTQYEDRWEISLNQTKQNGQPTDLTSQGIFAVFYEGNVSSMFYEVAQVEPAIAGVTPPTAQQGFGSTSNGAFGQANVQKYTWIGQ
jgi:hypothetical protein